MSNTVDEKSLTGTSRINEFGHLEIGGCDVVDLAAEYGTPLIVYDEALLRENCRRYKRSFVEHGHRVAYAGKAFLSVAMCQLIESEGLFLDVVSGGELHTALTAGFPARRIYFHGNNKSLGELKLALRAGVGHIIVDNRYEYSLLKGLLNDVERPVSILLRVALGVDAATHQYIRTGQHDSKFGFALDGDDLEAVFADAMTVNNLVLAGFHSHIGSQITSLATFSQAMDIMVELIRSYCDRYPWLPVEINLGGGLGVNYLPGDEAASIEDLTRLMRETAEAYMAASGFNLRLVLEPGRSIVAAAGTTLYTVGSMKDVPGGRRYIAVDGGMTDNPRTALYQAKYSCLLANRATEAPAGVYSIAGKACESGDMLIWEHSLPAVNHGDILAIFVTGAYTYSMASNYNRLPRPAIVFVNEGVARTIIERETYADVVRLDKSLTSAIKSKT